MRFGAPIVSLSPGPFKKGRGISVSRRDLLVISALVTIRQTHVPKVCKEGFTSSFQMAKIVVSFKRSLLRLGILAGVGKDHEIAGAFRFDIRGGRVTCYLDDIRPLRNFGEGQRLEATFTTDSVMELTPDLVGPSITRNSGIIGERVDLSLDHDDMRQSSLVFHVTKRLLYTKHYGGDHAQAYPSG